MKRERLLLAILGAIFLVEVAVGIPALWSDIAGVRSDVTGDGEAASAAARLVAESPAQTAGPANPTVSAVASVVGVKPAAAEVARAAAPATIFPSTPQMGTPRAQVLPLATPSGKPIARATPPARPIALAARKSSPPIAVVDDEAQDDASASFAYVGHWEHVRAIQDGRTAGTSSRSHRPGSVATLTFTGTEVRLFGVCGPTGGPALLSLDGRPVGKLTTFYAATKDTHMLVYASPRLPWGRHRLSVSVAPDSLVSKPHYVNIDGAEYD